MAYALYTDPPLGRAGLNESEARRSGHKIRIGMRPMTRVGRAVEKGETKTTGRRVRVGCKILDLCNPRLTALRSGAAQWSRPRARRLTCRRAPSGPPRSRRWRRAPEAEERVTTWMMFFFTAVRLRSR
jgi:Pyridine nucleotide-disulphide oxidoreductase, dimerisation domain